MTPPAPENTMYILDFGADGKAYVLWSEALELGLNRAIAAAFSSQRVGPTLSARAARMGWTQIRAAVTRRPGDTIIRFEEETDR